MRVFVDSGGFLAVMDRNDPFHPIAREIATRLEAARAELYTSNFVVDEACTLVRARTSHGRAVQFLRSLRTSGIAVLHVTPAIEAEAERIFIRYADKDFSFTDCTSFALIDARRLDAFLAFDRHFGQYRFRHRILDLVQQHLSGSPKAPNRPAPSLAPACRLAPPAVRAPAPSSPARSKRLHPSLK